jgi:hypothetical protein
MAETQRPRIIRFAPRASNTAIDTEIVDRERAEQLAKMAASAIDRLDWDRQLAGLVGDSQD